MKCINLTLKEDGESSRDKETNFFKVAMAIMDAYEEYN